MAWLFIFAFLSGLVTIAAPCIWPVLPIVLSASATGTRAKPLGITLGIMTSFAFFTLTLSYLIKIIPFDPNLLRLLAVSVIGFLGLTLLIPKLNLILEKWVSRLSSKAKIRYGESGFRGGLVTGLSVGIVWSPCAGPILATIATLAATQAVSLTVVLVTIFYVLGVGVPLFLFAFLGNRVFAQSKIIAAHTRQIQKIFGAVMILTAIAIVTNTDKLLQVKLLDHFPAYSRFLYKFEGDSRIKKELSLLRGNNPVSLENKNKPLTVVPSTLPNLGRAPELTGVTKWLNTDSPLTLADLKGKVVLVDFWTYTCINCLRTLPHVNSWYEAYRDQGLVVIGVHTPEFEFEKSTNNVKMAIDMYKIRYPVAQDNDYATWNAYSNQYWPAEYLIDGNGNLRRIHFGEGEYAETEDAIRALLNERGQTVKNQMTQVPDETPHIRVTPETYVGLARLERFSADKNITAGSGSFTLPVSFPVHHFGFGGIWDVAPEFSTAAGGSKLRFEFYADKVFLVMHPKTAENKVRVYLDGKLVDRTNSGADAVNGVVTVNEPRLYQIIDLKGKSGEHLLELRFENDGTQVYAFTFG